MRSPSMGGTVRQTVLDNGIRVVTEAVPGVRSVSICALVESGPRDESVDQSGLAHFCEHMMFQGTSSRSASEIARFMDSAGGGMGAFTSHDYTCYSATVLDDYSPFALDLLGDMLLNSTFPDDKFRGEQAAVLCEMEAEADRPSSRTRSLMREIAWPNHPLGRTVTGHAESVRALTRDDAIYFVHQHYLPTRIIMTAAGCVDHDDFTAGVRDGFWRMMGDRVDRRPDQLRAHGGLRAALAPMSLAYFSLGLPAPPYAADDRYAMHVLTKILGGGISSRLYRHVREERGWAFDISADYVAYLDGGLLSVEGSTPPQTLESVLQLVKDTLAGMAVAERITDDEIQRARAQIRSQVLVAGEDMHTRMSRLALQALYFGRPVADEEVLAGVDRVDAAAVARVAADCLAGVPAVAVSGPERIVDELDFTAATTFAPLEVSYGAR